VTPDSPEGGLLDFFEDVPTPSAPQEEFSLNLLITDENGKAKFYKLPLYYNLKYLPHLFIIEEEKEENLTPEQPSPTTKNNTQSKFNLEELMTGTL
jgi:hypothetical protein